ncbi:hypothetical protein [Thalassovita aquimarina]|uniref:hypothetical protein n=1 Tax=Thalassovita aquimarina TaxID=2785917 RepID=UPI003567FA55
MFGFRFKSKNGRWLTLWALGILGFPLLLWLIGYLGGCVASSTSAHCENIPDFFASVLFAFYVFLVFGGWAVSGLLIILAIAMLVLAVTAEIGARRETKR